MKRKLSTTLALIATMLSSLSLTAYAGDVSETNITFDFGSTLDINEGEDANFTVTCSIDGPSYPSGSVTIYIDNEDMGHQPLTNGQAVCSISGLSAGEHDLSVSYPGDNNYYPNHADGHINVNIASAPAGVSYIYYTVDGTTATMHTDGSQTSYTVVESSSSAVTWNEGWYVVSGDVTIANRITLNGNVDLILCDGATLTITGDEYEIGIDGYDGDVVYDLTVYGQSEGSGRMSVTGGPAINNVNYLTINGGSVEVNGTSYGIGGENVTINGGELTVTGRFVGFDTGNGTVTINGGKLTVTSGGNAFKSEWGWLDDSGTVKINGGELTATGNSGVVRDFSVINAIAGTGWTDAAGTEGETAIAVSTEGQDLSSYKKVVFTAPEPEPDPVPYVYYTASGTTATKHADGSQTSYTVVTDQTEWNDGGWYVVNSDVTIADRITVSGTVNLILCDGKTLTASKGITVNSENTLNIYAQSEDEGSGALTATGAEFEGDNAYAGIGGTKYNAGGTVIIHGGNVTAKGGKFGAGGAAGIGGGFQGAGGSVTIYAGTVDATGNSTGAGIGGGSERAGGSVAIYGGTVTATGGVGGGAGIGGGSRSAGGSVAIHGGTVTATGGSDGMLTGMGIGAGGTFTFEDPLDGGSLTLGTGVTMEVSSNNSTWTNYDGSTRARYMKSSVTVIEFLLTLDAVSNGTLAIVGEELPEGVTATATEGQYKVVSGTSVTIKATPAEGYHLVSWSNSADMNEDDTQTITLTDDLTLSVTFAADVVTPVGSVTIQDTEADEWYDLTGRRLNGKPATRGLYIHNNTKTIVK